MRISPELKDKLRAVVRKAQHDARQVATITVACSLDEATMQSIHQIVPALANTEAEVVVDDSLIAGFVVTIGSTVYDYSLRSRIRDHFHFV